MTDLINPGSAPVVVSSARSLFAPRSRGSTPFPFRENASASTPHTHGHPAPWHLGRGPYRHTYPSHPYQSWSSVWSDT